jgi:hypothetical protein
MTKLKKCTALILALVIFGIVLFRPVQWPEVKADPYDKVAVILQAINKIRTARDVKLDCADYVDPYLGHSNFINDYVDQFKASGLQPISKYLNSKYYTFFEAAYSRLKGVPDSKFGRGDVLIIVFVTENQSDNSQIKNCSAVLKAAPGYP